MSAGHVVTVTIPGAKPGTTTYYTLDGTDPRLPGGAIRPGALSATNTPLYDPNHPSHTWRVQDAVDYTFPMNVSLPAGGHLVLVSYDPNTNAAHTAAFQMRHNLPPEVPLYGPWNGTLDNSSDTVELTRPAAPEVPPSPAAGFVPYILVERVLYKDKAPWPSMADGIGAMMTATPCLMTGRSPTD